MATPASAAAASAVAAIASSGCQRSDEHCGGERGCDLRCLSERGSGETAALGKMRRGHGGAAGHLAAKAFALQVLGRAHGNVDQGSGGARATRGRHEGGARATRGRREGGERAARGRRGGGAGAARGRPSGAAFILLFSRLHSVLF